MPGGPAGQRSRPPRSPATGTTTTSQGSSQGREATRTKDRTGRRQGPVRTSAGRGRAEGAPLAAVPLSPARRPVRPRAGPARRPRADSQSHGRRQKRYALIPRPGKPPQPVSPRTPISPAPGVAPPPRAKVQPARKGALRALTPKDQRPSPRQQHATARMPAVPQNRHRGHYQFTRKNSRPPPEDPDNSRPATTQQPHGYRTAAGTRSRALSTPPSTQNPL
jgi:hypothetical protein